MAPRRRGAVLFLLMLSASLLWLALAARGRVVVGTVHDRHGPVADAVVRWQGGEQCTHSDRHGRFRLPRNQRPLRLTAAKQGFLIATGSAGSPNLLLKPVPHDENDDYAWIEPSYDPAQPLNCANCHREIFEEWTSSAHGNSAKNQRFLSLFGGTNDPLFPMGSGAGGEGPPASVWNLQAEHPLGSGVCANCHAPTLTSPDLDYDIRQARGVDRHGVHCDYCHKIADAPIDKLGTRFGRDGYRLVRLANGEQLFFGPLDDAVRPGESFAYAPFYKESRYCASCHEGVIFGVHVYGTYSEWLASPAARQGQQCQHCHMTPTGKMTNIAPGKGGVERDPRTLASHGFPGGTVEMLKKCLEVKTGVERRDNVVVVTVSTTARNVGHRVPTGFIDRHLILMVEAHAADGRDLRSSEGPRLPARVGPHWAERAGWIYGKQHLNAADQPLPFWRDGRELIDTRLEPEKADERRFVFAGTAATVRIRVIYRRFWDQVARLRDWSDNDRVIVDESRE